MVTNATARRTPSPDRPRSITLLGATGSVGQSTLALVREQPAAYRVEVVTAQRRAVELAVIARELGSRLAVVADEEAYPVLRDALAGTGITAAAGTDAIRAAAAVPTDWVMSAIVGAAGLEPTMTALRRGAIVALANKECLVCAGQLFMDLVAAHGAVLLPVDSEHNAIFQALNGSAPSAVERLILTASGGPFREREPSTLASVTPEEAVAHPNWSMGAKISVDSATMMNKGLEVIEAHWLFGLPEARIEVVVHPQSIIHSLVGFKDGSLLAQLGAPDMRIPIAHALGWPERLTTTAPRLDLLSIPKLAFEPPDPARFPSLRLARQSLQAGGAAPTILNAANEVAVSAFLQRRIGFLDIARTVEAVLDRLGAPPVHELEGIVGWDAAARRAASGHIERGGLRQE